MAALWGETEREGESGLGAPLADRKWVEVSDTSVSGMSVVLLRAPDVIQVLATPSPPTECVFKAVFDKRRLDDAGFGAFGPRMDFEKRVKVIMASLKADDALVATLKPDSGDMKLVIHMPVIDFAVDFQLPLKRVQLTQTDILSAKLTTTEQSLAESRALFAEMQQINEEQKAKIRALESQLTESKSAVSKAKAESHTAAEQSMADLRTEIRIRDAEICELKKATAFFFDSTTKGGTITDPSKWKISADGKSAVAKESEVQMLISPPLHSNSQITIEIEKICGLMGVGVTDDYNQWLNRGCEFYSKGYVKVKNSKVAESQAFGDWKAGDRLLVSANLSNGTVSIRAPNGEYTAKWTPRRSSSPVWFAVFSSESGSIFRIIE